MAELPKHFHFDYKKIETRPSSIIKGKKYRISILSELLIRLEYSENGLFEDRPTELVINRNFDEVKFEKKEDEKYLTIKTDYFTLTYLKEMPFEGPKTSPDQFLRIDLNNSDKYWFYNHPEARNFKGTTISLDNILAHPKYGKGLYSTDGFVSLDDKDTLIFNEDGSLGRRPDFRIDTYVFMYRRDFGACLRDYFKLTGYPPLIPRYALGLWWNKNKEYNAKDIEKLVFNFNKNRIPLSVILLSDKWHRENPVIESGFTFNENLFKRPKKTSDFLHSKGIRWALRINPFDGISQKEDFYIPFKNASGLEGDGRLPFNVYNKNVLNAYFNYFIHPLMNEGVDFFWIDYKNQNDIYNLRAINHYQFKDFDMIENRRGMILSRSGCLASHRYPVQYSGNISVDWKNLEMLPEYNTTASNLGLSWISNDIGGFSNGIEDGELYSRFVQFGCFSPIMRLTSDTSPYYKREPWMWDISTSSVCTRYMRLRHELIPYLYSEAYVYSKDGLPLVEPLYYRYPEIYDEPLYRNEYYFGSNLFVAPITKKGDSIMNRSILKMYLPEGTWYDFTTGKKYIGGKRYTAFYKLEDYPVFAKEGTIIPMAILDEENINNTNPPKKMELQIFPGKSSSYELYEDDGISSLHEQGFSIITGLDYTYQPNNVTVIIRPIKGKSGIIPQHRVYKIRFKNMNEPNEVVVHIADQLVEVQNAYTDENDFVIELPALSTLKQITISCKGKNMEIDSKVVISDDINSILSDLPIATTTKVKIGELLLSDMPINTKRIEVRKLKKIGVSQKYIILFLKLLEYLAEV